MLTIMKTIINTQHFAVAAKPTVAFTTPANYAERLAHHLSVRNYNPLWCPTIIVEPTPETLLSLKVHLSPPNLEIFSAIALTSRAGIAALINAISGINSPLLPPNGEIFTIAALGKDSELLDDALLSRICSNPKRIKTLVPPTSTPRGLVESLGMGHRRKVLCPVPKVVGLVEPPVVPDFLRELEKNGWISVRSNAYETRWAGKACAKEVVKWIEVGKLDAIVFTSTGEVEGFLKSLREFRLEWDILRERCANLVVAAHGPVTASGAERLGVKVDVVSSKFDSFQGVVDALDLRLCV